MVTFNGGSKVTGVQVSDTTQSPARILPLDQLLGGQLPQSHSLRLPQIIASVVYMLGVYVGHRFITFVFIFSSIEHVVASLWGKWVPSTKIIRRDKHKTLLTVTHKQTP